MSRREASTDPEADQWFPGAGRREEWEATANGYGAFSGNDGNVLELDSNEDFQIY